MAVQEGVKYVILLLASIVFVGAIQAETLAHTQRIKNGTLNVNIENNIIKLVIKKDDGATMKNVLRTRVPGGLKAFVLDTKCGPNKICIKSGNKTHTVIEAGPNTDTILITRNVSNPQAEILDCYELPKDTDWFGGPQLRYQHWPIQNMYYEEEPYVPTHPVNMALSERYWLGSNGIYLFVDEKDPLFLDQNNYMDKHLCLVAKNKAPYRLRKDVTLTYEIGVFPNPRLAHENVIRKHFAKPQGHPNERMVRHPIWSTWARYKANVSEQVVERFAQEILSHRFNNSQIEIDDNWETCYGSAVFDTKKFPDITRLTRSLKQRGFRVTLWIHPFINKGCEPAYSTALNNSYFVKNVNGNVYTQWWQGNDAGAIDFTNPKAVTWWVTRLKRLQQSGIDSFKFDAGEVSFLPQVPSLNGALDMQPGIFTSDYVSALARNFDDNIEVRVGWRTQDLPIFVRMIDKDTRWSWNNGLPTLISTLLQMNLNGYMFVLPDMIGGNGYLNNMLNGTYYPSKDMFIRWLQSNVFMPSLQYSFVPWDYDNETIEICRQYTRLHDEMTPVIMKLMKEAVATGKPINLPIWWVDPTDRIAHGINDEYLLGEDILVAPVIEEDAISRDIYLPSGKWRDVKNNITYNGPVWLRDYSAPLSVLPYFVRA